MGLREEVEKLARQCAIKAYGAATGQSDYDRLALAVMEITLEAAATHCENLTYGVDINQWQAMTKKGHAAHACRECAARIRSLAGK